VHIIGSCDLMVTPVHDPQWKEWCSSCIEINDAFSDYKAPGFTEYLGRGWCSLEMFLNANIPFDVARRKHLFGGELRQVMSEEMRRPHLLFGTRELELGQMPLILRALGDFEFAKYNPSQGALTDERDAITISSYVEDLFQMNTNLKVLVGLVMFLSVC
jgi:hypothetical protein